MHHSGTAHPYRDWKSFILKRLSTRCGGRKSNKVAKKTSIKGITEDVWKEMDARI